MHKPANENVETFAEVPLFGTGTINGTEINGDCGCDSCDGNPCVKIYD